ncbi:MAG: arsenate reductase family protein [Boseongicola sp.]
MYPMIVLYGIPTCDTCRKARKSLESNGLDVSFRDVRIEPLSHNEIARFFDAFGARLLNTRSTTWRTLGDNERSGDPINLLIAHPALMKRPVIEAGKTLTLGWDAAAQAAHLGDASTQA